VVADRVSANAARIGKASLQDVAFSAVLRGGRLELSLASGSGKSGSVRGRVAALASEKGIEVKLQTGIAEVEADEEMMRLIGLGWISGTFTGQVEIDAVGTSVADLARSAIGKVTMTLADGSIAGIDLGDLMRQAPGTPTALLPFGTGATAVAAATLKAKLWNGIADILDGTLSLRGSRASLTGRVGVHDQHLALKLVLTPGAASVNSGGRDRAFDLKGPWSAPALSSVAPAASARP
jgi:AsmA protein